MHTIKWVGGLIGIGFFCTSFAVAWSEIDHGSGIAWSGRLDATPPTPRTEAIGMQAEATGMHNSAFLLAQAGGQGQSSGSVLGYYLGLVDYKISSNWNPVASNVKARTRVVIRFRVMRSGHVTYLAVETSSGDAALDQAALDALWRSIPLPPFPNLLIEPFLDLHYQFVVERG